MRISTNKLLPIGVILATTIWPVAAATNRLNNQTFTVPDGYTIELVAGSELVQRPVSASFDDQGRLYVTDSSGSNLPPSEQLKNPTHRIVRLEDTDGDGRFDQSTVYAEQVMFPQGCLWHEGSVYMAGPPSIWRFTDTNGDGIADAREEWFKGGTLTGCANDIHGPHLGPEGYIYWTKGAFAEQKHQRPGKPPIHDSAAHIFRARPNGSDLDVVMSGGMDNPVEVAFTAEGEAVFTSTFIDFSQPGWRDGIGHAVYGGVFGKDNGVIEDGRVKRTSPELLHPFVQFGAGAPSGLCRYSSSAFGADFQNNLFASTFNLHKITRHQLRPKGATYESTDSDFVVSDSLDFHPTDVLEDADGSLLIVDTGGWYKLCCPTSQLAKPDVLGGIYRVRRIGVAGLSASNRGAAYKKLNSPPPLRDDTAEVKLKRAALAADIRSAGLFRTVLATNASVISQNNDAARLVRIAAEGLGRIGDLQSVPAILEITGAAGVRDPVLTHSLVYALIQIGDTAAVRKGTSSENPFVRRAALIVLDQIEGGLKPEDVTPHLISTEPALRQAAAWIVSRHPEWGGALAGMLRSRLESIPPSESDRIELQQQIARFAKHEAIQDLLATAISAKGAATDTVLVALRAMNGAGLKQMPASWAKSLTPLLSSGDETILRQAVAIAKTLTPPKTDAEFWTALRRVGSDSGKDPSIRLDALAAFPGGVSDLENPVFMFLVGQLSPTQPVVTRGSAAAIIARSKLSEAQLSSLVDAVTALGPLEIPKILPAFSQSRSESTGLRLVAALKQCKGASTLRPEVLRPHLTNFPVTVQQGGDELLASLNTDSAKQKAHLEALLGDLKGKGDIRRGQAIFNSAKAACAACHAMGYLGGRIGPDLTSIGQVRSERDLLESIIYPSASFVRSFEPMSIVTKSGDEVSGVLRKEAADELVLATGPENEVRLARSEVVEMRPGTVSLMPQGLDEQLSREELADLIAFLKNTRWGAR